MSFVVCKVLFQNNSQEILLKVPKVKVSTRATQVRLIIPVKNTIKMIKNGTRLEGNNPQRVVGIVCKFTVVGIGRWALKKCL